MPDPGADAHDSLPTPDAEWRPFPFPVVGIGASAGGLEALEAFFSPLGAEPGAAFVVIMHLDPNRKSMLAELLARHTDMPVTVVTGPTRTEKNHVYVLPPDGDLVLQGRQLVVRPREKTHGVHHPVDRFLESLASVAGDQGVAVILTGNGSDGAHGSREVKGSHGVLLVQDPATAAFDGMPRHALGHARADGVFAVEELGARLRRYLAADLPLGEAVSSDAEAREIGAILQRVLDVTAHDFRAYKLSTVRRRLARRALLRHCETLADYRTALEGDEAEVRALFHDLLINVTSFFRDPGAFAHVREVILPRLLDARTEDETLRVWVPGCASGEEAYTLAMLLDDALRATGRRHEVQIFATDLDETAVARARASRYLENIDRHVPEAYRTRYLRFEEGSYQPVIALREMMVFAPHDLLRDPPFVRLDLISCRNLLIYLDHEEQERVLRGFHHALKPDGILLLGPSESLGGTGGLFRTLHPRWKLYARGGEAPAQPLEIPRTRHRRPPVGAAAAPAPTAPPVSAARPSSLLERHLLHRYAPPAVLVSAQHELLYFFGNTHHWFDDPEGEPTLDLFRRLHRRFRPPLREALARLKESGEPLELGPFTHQEAAADEPREVVLRLEAIPRPAPQETVYLLTFVTPGQPWPARPATVGRGEDVDALEEELRLTRTRLQETIETLESTNEELKSSNEELVAMNEELQSSNEELETSKEELQALNEELVSVNAELNAKMDDLQGAYNDIENFVRSTPVATLFVDREMRVVRFTETAGKLFKLIASDVGRPLEDLNPILAYPELRADCEAVRDQPGQPRERDVTSSDGRRFLARLGPYVKSDGSHDGVVLTLVDITALAHAQEELRRHQNHLEELVTQRTGELHEREALLRQTEALAEIGSFEYYPQTDTSRWSEQLFALVGRNPDEGPLPVSRAEEIFVGPAAEKLRTTLENAIADRVPFAVELPFRNPEGETRQLIIEGQVEHDENEAVTRIYGWVQDVTERRAVRSRLDTAERRAREVIENTTDGFLETDREFNLTYINQKARRLLSLDRDITGENLWEAFPEAVGTRFYGAYQKALSEQVVVEVEEYYPPEDRWFRAHAYPTAESLSVYFRDVTDERRIHFELRAANERLREAQRIAEVGDWHWDIAADRTTWSPEVYRMLEVPPDKTITYEDIKQVFGPDFETADRAVRNAIEHGEPYEIEVRRRTSRGEGIFLARGVPVRNEQGKVIALKGSLQDITERYRQQRAMIAAREEAERALQVKSDFLAVVSHELRSPLNTIIGPCELLAETAPDAQTHELMTAAARAGRHLLELVNRVLDLARIEAGSRAFTPEPLTLASFVPENTDTFQSVASRRGLKLNAAVDPAVPGTIFSDPTAFRQILFNLVDNALAYTTEGRVDVTLAPDADDPGWLTLSVADTGPGIPEDQQERIFAPFAGGQAGGVSSARKSTGLGLSIARELARQMGGELTVNATVGKGSRFTFRFPAAESGEAFNAQLPVDDKETPALSSPADMPALPGADEATAGRILVVDDDAMHGLLLTAFARDHGLAVDTAVDGESAVAAFRPGVHHIIILDLRIRGRPPREIVRRLRGRAGVHRPVCLAQTGYTSSAQQDELKTAGFDGVLLKPTGLRHFREKLEAAISAARQRDTHATPPES